MAEELQEENILVPALGTANYRLELTLSGSFSCDTIVEKENISPAIAAGVNHEVDTDRQNYEQSFHKCRHHESDGNHRISFWEKLQEDLQAVLPNNTQFTYGKESFKHLPFEDFSGAPKYAFELQARIHIHTTEHVKEWLFQMFLHSNVHIGIRGEDKGSLKRCCIKYICIVSIKRKY